MCIHFLCERCGCYWVEKNKNKSKCPNCGNIVLKLIEV